MSMNLPFLDEPVPNFFFSVKVLDNGSVSSAILSMASQLDASASAFVEVSGLTLGIEVKGEKEACNAIEIPLPGGLTNEALTLKRCVRPRHIAGDPMTTWCQETFEAAKHWKKGIKTKDILILIMHPHLKNIPFVNTVPVAGFLVKKAYPVKWDMDSLNSTGNEPLQETIELKYRDFQRISVP